ncbi:cytochrome P450 [Russula ochroleuca]|uniref:Cytochrome P450 n=1 Tax=Russula ochroleuca TaxID=152965 RepID=A0A9P5TBX6_9AGAM|nr:cytochrome P450 [Russula ochroleuca]
MVSYARSSRQRLPPQPRRLPIIGNWFQTIDRRWLFSREYDAFDVLEDRASSSSGRPRLILANEILYGGFATSLPVMDHGEVWRRMRRAAQEAFTKVAVQRYHPILTKEATILVSALLTNPEGREQHIQRTAASAIMSISYDYPTLTSGHDKAVQDMDRHVHWVARASARTSPVEFFPWMIHIPKRFAKWKRESLKRAAERSEIFLRLFNRVKTDLVSVGVRPSFSATLIEHHDRYRLSEREMVFLAGQMYGAGFDTTSTTLMWWTLAMVAFPEVQCRAQAELGAVVGRARLPTFADAPRLPYVRAIIREVSRWRPALRLGLPHAAAEDEWYDGMFIPKGATCIANIWHCNHDRAVFSPKETNKEGHVSFGFGRRICVGKNLANDSLFIYTARVLWAANLGCARDENGKERPPDTSAFVDGGITSRPLPYDCIITPRFQEALSILVEERESFQD